MPPTNLNTRKGELQKRMVKAGLIGAPGFVLVALGMNALFGEALMPWMQSRDVALSLLGVGGVILIWEMLILVPTVLELGRLNRGTPPAGRPKH